MQDVSSALFTFGLYTVWCALFFISSQFISAKKGWDFNSTSPAYEQPNLFEGSLSRSLANKLVASTLKNGFIIIGFSTISLSIYCLSLL